MSAPELELRRLEDRDAAESSALGALAFGGDLSAPPHPPPPGSVAWGVFDGTRMLAKARLRPFGQWWGGQRVPMGGVAGVAVHPDARGRGAAGRLMRTLLEHLRTEGTPISALFPTAPGIYRSLGWELCGTLPATPLRTAALRGVRVDGPAHVLRTAGPEDSATVSALWQAHAPAVDGALTREAPSFAADAVLRDSDVVTLAELDGQAAGYVAYDRGRGYDTSSQLEVSELVAATPAARAALLSSIGSWDAVAPTALWWGPLDDVALLLPSPLPPPTQSRPWMLRVADAPGAFAARGYPPGLTLDASFTLVDPQVPEHEGAWHLHVEGGAGRLERTGGRPPRLDVRGLARVFAGVAGSADLVRTGLLDSPVPALDGLRGPAPRLSDYF